MWARVKGRTESALLSLFPHSYMFRLAALRPMHGEVQKTALDADSYALFTRCYRCASDCSGNGL